ncbi:MAG: glycosyltransferase family 4 protein [Chloroflexota bacterium]
MKIMQLAPLWERVPPPAYGGIEYIVSLLTEELVRQGHDVTLAASGDSLTSAKLISGHYQSLRLSEQSIKEPLAYHYAHVAKALADSQGFDLIHNHASELPMAMQRLIDTPMLTTLHNLVTPDMRVVWSQYGGYYNTPSRAAKADLMYPNFAGVIYHGIDVESFPFQAHKDDYLLYLGRMSPEKGPREAIEVAKRLGRKLIMAGKVDNKDFDFFWSEIAPLIDGNLVEYRGEANADYKRELYRNARCLLFPITWNEPFGLVMTESMACGTPVVALRAGAAPEVIQDGLSGYIVDDVPAMAQAVARVERLDPYAIRAYVEKRFSVATMTKAYLAVYDEILEREAARRGGRVHLVTPPKAIAS